MVHVDDEKGASPASARLLSGRRSDSRLTRRIACRPKVGWKKGRNVVPRGGEPGQDDQGKKKATVFPRGRGGTGAQE